MLKIFSPGWPGGWVGGWLDQMEIRLNSASVEVEVEVEAELGNFLNPDYYHTNIRISLAVQNFISKTKRFS